LQAAFSLNYSNISIRFILIAGCIIIAVQFVAAPKYSVYTYAAFEEDNWVLLAIFTCHETIFMWQAWTMYLSIVTISSINAIEFYGLLNEMTRTMASLKKTSYSHYSSDAKSFTLKPDNGVASSANLSKNEVKVVSLAKESLHVESVREESCSFPLNHRYTSSEQLIQDYVKLMLASDLLNKWCSYRIIGVHTIGYCQFVADVFMMIQLLRLPEMDLPAVLWFGEDALVR
jgi:hypothetical protein